MWSLATPFLGNLDTCIILITQRAHASFHSQWMWSLSMISQVPVSLSLCCPCWRSPSYPGFQSEPCQSQGGVPLSWSPRGISLYFLMSQYPYVTHVLHAHSWPAFINPRLSEANPATPPVHLCKLEVWAKPTSHQFLPSPFPTQSVRYHPPQC